MISMQIDIGFGDIISPAPQALSYPTVLELPAPMLRGYTPESVIAEKLETMIKRGLLNSRMKDFYDVWVLSQQFAFNCATLTNAIQATFKQRRTTLEAAPECFSENRSNEESPVAIFYSQNFSSNSTRLVKCHDFAD